MNKRKNVKFDTQAYASITDSEGVNYRDIAEMMTEIGYSMNHSSARNYVLRIMSKFAKAITKDWGISASEADIDRIAKSPSFQQGICDILQNLETYQNVNFQKEAEYK